MTGRRDLKQHPRIVLVPAACTGLSLGVLSCGPPALAADSVIELPQAAVMTVIDDSSGSHDGLGTGVTVLGDVNGDKCGDLGVRAGETSSYVVFGCSGSTTVDLASAGSDQSLEYGGSISAAGDVNGDGIADVLLRKESSASVIFGGKSTQGAGPRKRLGRKVPLKVGPMATAVQGIGDVNGDGFSDLAVNYPKDTTRLRGVYVVFGGRKFGSLTAHQIRSQGFRITRDAQAEPPQSLRAGGDVNGGGMDDILLGSTMYSKNPGAFVVLGRQQPGSVNLDRMGYSGWSITDPEHNYYASYLMVGPGDVNGDGRDEVMSLDPYDRTGYVLFGKRDFVDVSLDDLGSKGFAIPAGYDVAGIGDLNGDRLDDILIRSGTVTGSSAGLVLGQRTTSKRHAKKWSISEVVHFDDAADPDLEIASVAGGNLSADKIPDVVIGVSNYATGPQNVHGAVYVVSGRSIRKVLSAGKQVGAQSEVATADDRR